MHPEDKRRVKKLIQQAIDGLSIQQCEYRIRHNHQNIKHLHSSIHVKRNDGQRACQLLGFTLDVTRQKIQMEALEIRNQKLVEIAWAQSHKVRAPLARLMGLTQLLKRYPGETVNLEDSLHHSLESANELDSIIRKIVRKTEEII